MRILHSVASQKIPGSPLEENSLELHVRQNRSSVSNLLHSLTQGAKSSSPVLCEETRSGGPCLDAAKLLKAKQSVSCSVQRKCAIPYSF
jgi:hypothetical protein